MNESKKTEKDANNEKQEKPLQNKLEGAEAVEALYDALGKEGILKEGDLSVRVAALEAEVRVLKELIASAINFKSEQKTLQG